MQEMDTVASAQQIMETDLRYQFNLDGAPLRLDYSHGAGCVEAALLSRSQGRLCTNLVMSSNLPHLLLHSFAVLHPLCVASLHPLFWVLLMQGRPFSVRYRQQKQWHLLICPPFVIGSGLLWAAASFCGLVCRCYV